MTHPQVGVARLDAPDLEAIRAGAWDSLAEKQARENTTDLSSDREPNLLVEAIRKGWPAENILLEFGAGSIPEVRFFGSGELPAESPLVEILVGVGIEKPSHDSDLPEYLRSTKRIVILGPETIENLRNQIVLHIGDAAVERNDGEIDGERRTMQALESTLSDAVLANSEAWIAWERRPANKLRIKAGGCRIAESSRAIKAKDLSYFTKLKIAAKKRSILQELAERDHMCEARHVLALSTVADTRSFSDPWDATAFLYLVRAAHLRVSPLVQAETNHRAHPLPTEEEASLLRAAKAAKAGHLDHESLDTIARESGNPLDELSKPDGRFQYELRAVAGEVISFLRKRPKTPLKVTLVCACV